MRRVLIFLTVFLGFIATSLAQLPQDKEQAKLYMEQADLIMAETRAMDDARELMVTAANYDTTNIKANFDAGHMHLETIGKDLATKFFLRIYRQDPDYRFDLEYWIGKSYQYGLSFDNAIDFYNRYKEKLQKKSDYKGRDKVDLKEVERRIIECQNGKEFVANPKNYSIVNLGREVNSEFEDYGPVVSANEDELIFTTRRRDGNLNENVADDNKPYEDVFYSKKTSGQWSRAANIGPTVNTPYNDSNLALAPDGQTLFLYKDENGGDIFVCERQPDGSWSAPEPLPGVINSSYKETSVSITEDGNRLYFSSNRPGGFGGFDIYVCTKDNRGEWARTKNLGPTINTELDEDSPFIDYDSKTLYFSSKGRKGMGEFDIFKATLLDDVKNEWTEPENLGYPINTPDDDVFYISTKNGDRGYYSSVREDGLGYSDIYVITVPETKEPAKEPVVATTPPVEEPAVEEPKTEPKAEPQPIKYVVTVTDAATKAPLDAKVRMRGTKDNVVLGASSEGKGIFAFKVTSTSPKDYQLSVEKEGYAFENLKVSLPGISAEAKTINRSVAMRKLSVGVRGVLRNIYFDFGMATFKTESYAELNKLESMMKQNEALRVEISGHTDNVGDKIHNQKLSLKRANAVKNFLVSKNIDPRRITTAGYGSTRPLASNDDEIDGRELNRRVEFKVLGN